MRAIANGMAPCADRDKVVQYQARTPRVSRVLDRDAVDGGTHLQRAWLLIRSMPAHVPMDTFSGRLDPTRAFM